MNSSDSEQPPLSDPELEVWHEAAPLPHTPVASRERIDVIDMLRGFALLGILIVNMEFYTTPLGAMMSEQPFWPEPRDVMATDFIEVFAAGKFYTLFSFLFGVGIAVQWTRAKAKGSGFVWYHLRRMTVLLVIGLLHAYLIWMGDILTTYALLGFVLVPFLNRKPRTLLIWSIIVFTSLMLLWTGSAIIDEFMKLNQPPETLQEDKAFQEGKALGFVTSEESTESNPSLVQEIMGWLQLPTESLDRSPEDNLSGFQRAKAIYGHGTWLEILRLRARELWSIYPVIIVLQAPHSLALFLLGMYVGKKGFLADVGRYRWLFVIGWLVGLVFGAGGNVLKFYLREYLHADYYFLEPLALVADPALSCFYGCSIILLTRWRFWHRLFSVLTAVGQMALTNYLAQSIICTTIFYSHGLGLYAQVSPFVGLGLTLVIYLVEVLWSNLWLRTLRFKFGPMEWLWRSLTYFRLQPMW